MAGTLESPRSGLGRLAVGTALFVLLVPAPLLAFPLALLLAVSGGRTPLELFTGISAGAVSLAWLMQPGPLPDQLVRAAVVLAGVGFVAATLRTRATFTHRALFALSVAAAVIAFFFAAFGWPWEELAWWVRSRTSYATRIAVNGLRVLAIGRSPDGVGRELDNWIIASADFAAAFFPALIALQMLAGFALATTLYHRIATAPRGVPLGRLRDFRFSDHLGWAAAVPLVIVLLPRLATLKVAASNLLMVSGVLYALRGLAVAVAGAAMTGAGQLMAVFAVVGAFFLLPVMFIGAVLLGVLDAGVDLRRRWIKPPAGDQPWT